MQINRALNKIRMRLLIFVNMKAKSIFGTASGFYPLANNGGSFGGSCPLLFSQGYNPGTFNTFSFRNNGVIIFTDSRSNCQARLVFEFSFGI